MLVEEHNFTWNGEPIKFSIEAAPFIQKVSYMKRGLTEEITLLDFHPQYMRENISFSWNCNRLNPVDNGIENSTSLRFEAKPDEFTKFFFTPTGSYPIGVVVGRNLFNGLTTEYGPFEGARFFDVATLAPVQPVHVTTTVTGSTIEARLADGTVVDPDTMNITEPVTYHDLENGRIEVTPLDGIGPFEFKMDEGEFGVVDFFENLTSGLHTLTVKDSVGTLLVKEVIA